LVADVVVVDWCRQARKVVDVAVRDGRATCSRGRAKALANAERGNMLRVQRPVCGGILGWV